MPSVWVGGERERFQYFVEISATLKKRCIAVVLTMQLKVHNPHLSSLDVVSLAGMCDEMHVQRCQTHIY